MTYDEFIQALSKTPRDWRLIHGTIRRGARDPFTHQCPISAIGNKPSTEFIVVGKKYLSARLRRRIQLAADGFTNTKTRRDLLRACGLGEK